MCKYAISKVKLSIRLLSIVYNILNLSIKICNCKYKTQQMCDEAILENGGALKSVSDS